MRKLYSLLITIFILTSGVSNVTFAETKFGATTTTPSQTNSSQNSGNKPQRPDCSRLTADPRCKFSPYYYPYQNPQRPIIIDESPAEPSIDINSLTDDWGGCRKAKLGAMNARHSGNSDLANRLDEWLWKNCRPYSNELRELEQDNM